MSPRKLSNSDKDDILKLYRQSPETTSTLAIRYGVSSSTISRFLKRSLPEQEYEALIQQKRITRTPLGASSSVAEAALQPLESDSSSPLYTPNSRRMRRRSSAGLKPAATETEWIEALNRHLRERLEAVNAETEVVEAMINRLNRAMEDLIAISEYLAD